MNERMNLTQQEAIALAKRLHFEILDHFEGESAVFLATACVMSAGVLLVDQACNDDDFNIERIFEHFVGMLKEPVDAYIQSRKGETNEINYH